MIIKSIEINGFGKFSGNLFTPQKGFNLVFGHNEDGKTTLMSFIKMMFYSSSSKSEKAADLSKSLRKKYRPWSGEPMSGAIEFEAGGMEYRIQKEFLKSEASDKTGIFCKTTGETVQIPNKNDAGEYFFGMGLDEFERSIFIGQTGGFSADSASDSLAMRIANLSVSGDENISHELILKRLTEAAEELVSKSRKKGLLIEEEQKLENLKFEEQKLTSLEDDQKDIEAEVSKLEAEISHIEAELNAISDSQRLKTAKNELNAYYTLHNKLNLLNTVKKQLADYGKPETELREYIKKATELNQEIENSLTQMQDATAGKSLATVPDAEYHRLADLDQKAAALRQDLDLIRGRIKNLYAELDTKLKSATKSTRLLSILPFAISIAIAALVWFFIPNMLIVGIGFVGLGTILSAVMLFTSKKRAISKFSVQLAKRDLEGSLRELCFFNDNMLSGSVQNLEHEFAEMLSDTVSELTDGLAVHDCTDISQLKSKSAAAQTEEIKAITERLNLQKEQFIALACTINDSATFSAAKILYVELQESLNNFEMLTAEIDTICAATGIVDISADFVASQIKTLGEFIQNAPKTSSDSHGSVEELRNTLKEKRALLNSYISRIKHPEKNLSSIRKEIEESENRILELKARLRELNIAFEVMNEAILDTNKGLGSHLSETVGKYLSQISNDRYHDVIVPRDLSIETRSYGSENYHEWKYYSSGAIDRIYLCLRLAMTDIFTKDCEPMPLFFDDILAQYDDEGCKNALVFLKNYFEESGSASQIMFFTCHSQIAEMAKNVFGEINEIVL